jgi:hypothetical protein
MNEAQDRRGELERRARRRAGLWVGGTAALVLLIVPTGTWVALYTLTTPVQIGPYLVGGLRSGMRSVRQPAGMVMFLKSGPGDLAYSVYREGVPVGMALVRGHRHVVSFLPSPTCPPDLVVYMEPGAQPRAAEPVVRWFGLTVIRPFDTRYDPVIRIRGSSP